MGAGGSVKIFRRKISCLTVPKNSVGQPFKVSLISGIEKFYASEGFVTIFRRKFLSRSTEKLVGEHFCVSQNSSIEKIYGKEGGRGEGRRECHNFPSKIFCLTVPKNFVGEPFRVSLILGIKKFYA